MSKIVSRGQALEVSALVSTQVDWEQLDGDKLQAEVVSLPAEEFGRRMTAFFKNGMRFVFGGLKVACASFNPAEFINNGWAFWKGPKDGTGLEGEEERDKASMALTEVDFDKVDFVSNLKEGETSINGEEKLLRLKATGRVLYGATTFMGLLKNYRECQNKAESVLEELYQQKGITFVSFFGDVLRNPIGNRCVLYLYRSVDGQWDWNYAWLSNDWRSGDLTAVSQQVSS